MVNESGELLEELEDELTLELDTLEVEDIELLDDEVMLELDELELVIALELEAADEVLDEILLTLLDEDAELIEDDDETDDDADEDIELTLDELLLTEFELTLLLTPAPLTFGEEAASLPPEQAIIIAAHVMGTSILVIE
jgi:hypothetical protein